MTVHNSTRTVLDVTSLRQSRHYYQAKVWMNLIMMGIGPFLLLVVLNVLILIQLREMSMENNILATRAALRAQDKDKEEVKYSSLHRKKGQYRQF